MTQTKFKVGDMVRVKPSIKKPCYGWGAVSHGDVGIVREVSPENMKVDFPRQENWSADFKEMELVESKTFTPPFYVDCPTEEIWNKVEKKMFEMGYGWYFSGNSHHEYSTDKKTICLWKSGHEPKATITFSGSKQPGYPHIPHQEFLGEEVREEPKTATQCQMDREAETRTRWINKAWDDMLRPSYFSRYYMGLWPETELTPIKSSFKEKSMSLLKRLLDPELKLIEKYCMDSEGNLDFENGMVQEALLKTDGFKKNLVELCQAKAKEEKKK